MTEKRPAYNRKKALASEPQWSEMQRNILDAYENGTSNLMISALAGSGKTTMLAGMINRTESDLKVAIAAFNVHISTEIKKRVPTRVNVTTANGLGHSVLCRFFSGEKLNLDEQKYRKIAKERVEKMGLATSLKNPAISFMTKICSFVRLSLCELDIKAINSMIEFYNIEHPEKLEQSTVENIIDQIPWLIHVGSQMAKEQRVIDFTDQLWIPNFWDLRCYQKDVLFLDEAQDCNNAMIGLYRRVVSSTGRFIAVGDISQSIMGFSGSTPDAWDTIIRVFNAQVLPLNICYRCPSGHLDLARNFVPDLLDKPGVEVGIHATISRNNICSVLKPGDLVISRFRGPLIGMCLTLVLKYKIPAQIRGQDIAESIVRMVKASMSRGNSYYPMREFEVRWKTYINKLLEFARKEDDDRRVADLNDVDESVQQCYDAIPGAHTIEYFCEAIKKLFAPEEQEGSREQYVTLSTIHRAKGDEADRVFILGSNLLPSVYRCEQDWEIQQEQNLTYVALTRAKKEMYFIPLHKDEAVEARYLDDEMGGIRIVNAFKKQDKPTAPLSRSAVAEDHSWCKELNDKLRYFGLQYNDKVWIEKESKHGRVRDTFITGDRRYFCVEIEGYSNWLELGKKEIQKVAN